MAGAAYMLSLNQNQPSCYVMAGFLALLQKDGALAAEAFDKAIELKSPQSAELKAINGFVGGKLNAIRWFKIRSLTGPLALVFIVTTVAILVVLRRRQLRRRLYGGREAADRTFMARGRCRSRCSTRRQRRNSARD